MNQNLQNLFSQTLGAQVATDLNGLIEEYQAAQIAPWLISRIAPIEKELKASVTRLEQIEAQVRAESDQAEAQAAKAQAEASTMGAVVTLDMTEKRIQSSRLAEDKKAILVAAIRDTGEARRRLGVVQKLLAELGQITPPDAESIRGIVEQGLS